ncbi:DUF5671 domain-containing protein [Croceicoccus mobilis]|nr:DUF5671 domain-containing protein [Croceicoccus mobilis]
MAWSVLTDFLRRATRAGIGRDKAASALEDAGWPPAQVKSAIEAFADSDLPVAVPRPSISPTPKELFLYLTAFSCLYVAVMGLGTILFQLINIARPDPADFYAGNYFSMMGNVEAKLRSGVSSVVVFLPAYLFVDFRIAKLRRSSAGGGASAVRRKLTYLTLYFTAFVLLFDASFLVSYWLNGELDSRVLLKILVVAGIGALVLGRYLYEMSCEEHFGAGHVRLVRMASLGFLVAVSLAAVIAAFANFDPPGEERRKQADAAREAALAQIDVAVLTYFRAYDELPDSLKAVAKFEHVRLPRDPETGKPYGYEVTGERTYRLCTRFRTARTEMDLVAEGAAYGGYYQTSAFVEHPAGDHCFDMEVKEAVPYGQ